MPPKIIDSLDTDSLKPLVVELSGKVDRLLEQNSALLDQIKALNARIAELEGRNGRPPKTPANASLAPSRGHKATTPPAQKMRRKGRPGVARDLCENPDVTRNIFAGRCACGAVLAAGCQAIRRSLTPKITSICRRSSR